ncbi:MAG: ASKHA domain-containing protein, partial [Eubacteriaceae bacterium]|jgi:uncharacterized 2Fe-2S/4Fe-4S cluster protein (DUF4445 family)|nr:ASKHA domain-containing protein [Eubacteriaceae bacterium]
MQGSSAGPKTRHVSDEEYAEGARLACSSYLTSDAAVLVPDIASAYKSRMKIADLSSKQEVEIFNSIWRQVLEAGLTFDNDYAVLELEMEEPTFEDTMPDNERLARAVLKKTGASEAKVALPAMRKISEALRMEGFRAKAVVRETGGVAEILDVFPASEKAKAFCAVIDIGTTTVSALLSNIQTGRIYAKASSGNGQIRYGADVINRILESAKPGGREKLMDAVIGETINPLLLSMCSSAGVSMDSIYLVAVSGNTTMEHLFCGVNADYLRQEPFVPAFFRDLSIKAKDLGLNANENAQVALAPNIGSYVGGDITAGTLASMIWSREEFSLFLDLGTNGEIVFGNKDFLLACACSAGPAFEGGDLSCGMRATDGAIEKIDLDPATLAPAYTVIGGGKPVGLCGSGCIDLIAALFRAGAITAKGRFFAESDRIRHDSYGIGRYIVASEEESATGKEISINEVDIDNFVRAKGAIFSGIRVMLNSMEMDISMVSDIYVAGGIGSGVNMRNAVEIGLFPDLPLEQFHYIGNSSLSGAYCMAHSNSSKEKIDEIASAMTYIELSNIPSYMQEFVAACFLPHTDLSLFPSCGA